MERSIIRITEQNINTKLFTIKDVVLASIGEKYQDFHKIRTNLSDSLGLDFKNKPEFEVFIEILEDEELVDVYWDTSRVCRLIPSDEPEDVIRNCDYCGKFVNGKFKDLYIHRNCFDMAKADHDGKL